MYRIVIDKDRKFIHMEASGLLQLKELKQFFKELADTIFQFNKDEVIILTSLERLDPVSQDSINFIVENMAAISGNIKEMVFVHRRTITRMQQERIHKAVNTVIGRELPVKSFRSKEEALEYLYENA